MNNEKKAKRSAYTIDKESRVNLLVSEEEEWIKEVKQNESAIDTSARGREEEEKKKRKKREREHFSLTWSICNVKYFFTLR